MNTPQQQNWPAPEQPAPKKKWWSWPSALIGGLVGVVVGAVGITAFVLGVGGLIYGDDTKEPDQPATTGAPAVNKERDCLVAASMRLDITGEPGTGVFPMWMLEHGEGRLIDLGDMMGGNITWTVDGRPMEAYVQCSGWSDESKTFQGVFAGVK